MKRLIFIAILCLSELAFGQSWSGILDPSRAIDWSNAGAPHINDVRTQCVTTACNTVSGGTVTSATVDAAIASAPANTYVLLPAGTFTMSNGVAFCSAFSGTTCTSLTKSNVTIRGAGANSTFLVFSGHNTAGNCGGGAYDICSTSSDLNYWGGPTNTANFTGTNGVGGTYTKGATSITLSSTTNLTIGNPIILDQIDNQTDPGAGSLYVGCEQSDGSAACVTIDGPSGFQRGAGALATIRGQQQMVTVTNIVGSIVTISPGIYADNWATAKSPGAWWATSPSLNNAVENLSISDAGSPDGMILWFNCDGCWVKGVRSVATATTGTAFGHVINQICNRCTVRDSYFYGFSGDSYVIPAKIASDILIENNILQQPGGVVFNSDCEGCVSAYNFSVNPVAGANFFSQSQYYHSVQLFALQEGNIGGGLYCDNFHGSHVLDTQFRNRWDGNERNNGALNSSGTIAVRLGPACRYQNSIGNVLGTVGYHTVYRNTSPTGVNDYTSVFLVGVYPESGTVSDSLVGTTGMWWGNWDNVSNAVRWCGNSSNTGWSTTCSSTSEVPTGIGGYANAVPASQTLPSSFYLSSKPSWWPGGKAWPSIGPDVTGGTVGQCVGGTSSTSQATNVSQCIGGGTLAATGGGLVVSNPAMDCYFNTMSGNANGTGSALAFDANTCYAASTVSGVSMQGNVTIRGSVVIP
jgi:hypothetical protein